MIEKILFIGLFGLLIYFWNLYVIPMMIARVVLMNSANHRLKANKDAIIKGFQGFFWAAFVLLSYNNVVA